MNDSVVVLNASYEPLHNVSVKHAVKMLVREVAVIEEAHEGETFGPFPKPRILRLVKYVYVKLYRKGVPSYSRAAVLRRDRNICAYCLKHGNTIDHVIPRSHGGATSWENTVAACWDCNQDKAGRTPKQAGMKLLRQPFVPTYADLIK